MGQCASAGGNGLGVKKASPNAGQNSRAQLHTTDAAAAPYHCILLVSPPSSTTNTLPSCQVQPCTLLVGPDGQVRMGSEGGESLADFFSLTVFSLSEQCKLALSVSSEDEYARTLVDWCNSGDAGLGVVLRAVAQLASLPCLPGSTQSMTVSSSVPWPKPVLMGNNQQVGHAYGLITTAKSLPHDDSSVAMDGEERHSQPSSCAFIMLEHSLGVRLDSLSFPLQQLAKSITQQPPSWAETAAVAQRSLRPNPRPPSTTALPPDAVRSMLVAAEAPCMLTLITEQGLVLYQNDLSIEYFGDVVSAAAAMAHLYATPPNGMGTSPRASGRLSALKLHRAHEDSPRTSRASRFSSTPSQPGLRLLMALFKFQEEEDREEEEDGEEEEEEGEEEREEEEEEEGEGEEERVAGHEPRRLGEGSSSRRERRRKRDALDDIQNYRLLLDMLNSVIEHGITWNRTMKVPLALDTLTHQLFPVSARRLLASHTAISEVGTPHEAAPQGPHYPQPSSPSHRGSASAAFESQQPSRTTTACFGEQQLVSNGATTLASPTLSCTISNQPHSIFPWHMAAAQTASMQLTAPHDLGGFASSQAMGGGELEMAASGASFSARTRGVGEHAEGSPFFAGRKSTHWRRASALLPHHPMADSAEHEVPGKPKGTIARSKSFTHLKRPPWAASRRSAGGANLGDTSEGSAANHFSPANLAGRQHSCFSLSGAHPHSSFTLGHQPNLHPNTSSFQQQHSQPQAAKGPLHHAQIEHLQQTSRMSFSGPMRRPSSMTRAMVEKMMAQQQQQQQLPGSRSLQLQTSAGRVAGLVQADKDLACAQSSPRLPSTLGWPANCGLREINALWEVAAQQGSTVSSTAACVLPSARQQSGFVNNTSVSNAVLDGSTFARASARVATEETPAVDSSLRARQERPADGVDRASPFAQASARNQPQFSNRHAEQRQALRSLRSQDSGRLSLSAPRSTPNSVPLLQQCNGRASPEQSMPVASITTASANSSGRHSVAVEPSSILLLGPPSTSPPSNPASFATCNLLSSNSRTSHLLRYSRHASTSVLNAAGSPAPQQQALNSSGSMNRRSMSVASSHDPLVRSHSTLPSVPITSTRPTGSPSHSVSLPRQLEHGVQPQQPQQPQQPALHNKSLHMPLTSQPPQPPPALQHKSLLLPTRTSLSLMAPSPSVMGAGATTLGASSLLLPKAGGRVRAALNALEGSGLGSQQQQQHHHHHSSNSNTTAAVAVPPRGSSSMPPRRSMSTSQLLTSPHYHLNHPHHLSRSSTANSASEQVSLRYRSSCLSCNTSDPQHSPSAIPSPRARLVSTSSVPTAMQLGTADARVRSQRLHPPSQRWSGAQLPSEESMPNSTDLGDVLQWQQDRLFESLRMVTSQEQQEDAVAEENHKSLDECNPSSWQQGPPPPPPQQQQQQQQLQGPAPASELAAPGTAEAAGVRSVTFSQDIAECSSGSAGSSSSAGRSSVGSSSASSRGGMHSSLHRVAPEAHKARMQGVPGTTGGQLQRGSSSRWARGEGGAAEEEKGRYEEALAEELAAEGMMQMSWCWHEVVAKRCIDPVTGGAALLLVQRNITERAQLENSLSELTEAQLAMMSQIFPRHVIEALSMGNKEDLDIELVAKMARSHAHVTVLFMDLVGFTSMSKEIPPEEVIIFLNSLFGYFDRLVEKHRVQKIDTVGDAYLVASGILTPDDEGFNAVDESHNPERGAHRVLAFAQDMLRVSRLVLMPHSTNPVSIRIGIHTGPCVSGLIGTKLPKWTVLGGTINTAARAEQTCRPDHVQVTEATHKLLPPGQKELLEPTGGVFCKGLGMLDTYLWSPPSSWADETDLPSDFFDLLTPSTMSEGSSHRSSAAGDDGGGMEPSGEEPSPLQSDLAPLMAEHVTEEGSEELAGMDSGQDTSSTMPGHSSMHSNNAEMTYLEPSLRSQRLSSGGGRSTRPRHSSGGSSISALPQNVRNLGCLPRQRTTSSAGKANASQETGAPDTVAPLNCFHSRSSEELYALDTSGKRGGAAHRMHLESSKPTSAGQVHGLDGLSSLPSLSTKGSMLSAFGSIGSRRLTDASTPVSVLRAGSSRERSISGQLCLGGLADRAGTGGNPDRSVRGRAASGATPCHSGGGGDSNAGKLPTPPHSPSHLAAQQQQQQQQQQQRKGANAAGTAFVKLFRRPPQRSTSFVIPMKDSKAARSTDPVPLVSPSVTSIPRTSSEQQLSRSLLGGCGSGAQVDVQHGNSSPNSFSNILRCPTSASFSAPATRTSHLPQHGSQQSHHMREAEHWPGLEAGTQATLAPGLATSSGPPAAAAEQQTAPKEAHPTRAEPSTQQQHQPLHPPTLTLAWAPDLLDQAPSLAEAAVPLAPRKGRLARGEGAAAAVVAAGASQPQQAGGPSGRPSSSGSHFKSRSSSYYAQQHQQQQQRVQEPLPLSRAGTGGSDGMGGAADAADRQRTSFSRTPSITHSSLPFHNFQGLSALKAIGAACRRRSSVFSCGSNEEQRASAQGAQVPLLAPRGLSERVPGEVHAARMGVAQRRGSVAGCHVPLPLSAEQGSAEGPCALLLPAQGSKRARRASLDLGAAIRMPPPSMPLMAPQQQQQQLGGLPRSHRASTDTPAGKSRARRSSMDFSAFAAPLHHAAQAHALQAAQSALPPAGAAQGRGRRSSMDFCACAAPLHHAAQAHASSQTLPPPLPTLARARRCSMDVSATHASKSSPSSAQPRPQPQHSRRNSTCGWHKDVAHALSAPAPNLHSTPPRPRQSSLPAEPTQQQQQQQQTPPTPLSHRPSRGSFDVGVLSHLASTAMLQASQQHQLPLSASLGHPHTSSACASREHAPAQGPPPTQQPQQQQASAASSPFSASQLNVVSPRRDVGAVPQARRPRNSSNCSSSELPPPSGLTNRAEAASSSSPAPVLKPCLSSKRSRVRCESTPEDLGALIAEGEEAAPQQKAAAGITGSKRVSIAAEFGVECGNGSSSMRKRRSSMGGSNGTQRQSPLQQQAHVRRRASRLFADSAQYTGGMCKRSSSGALDSLDGDSTASPSNPSLISNLLQVSNIHGQLQRLRSSFRDRGSGGGRGMSSAGPSPALTLMASPSFQRRMSLGGSRRDELLCDGEEEQGEQEPRRQLRRSCSSEASKRSTIAAEALSGGSKHRAAGDRDRVSHGIKDKRRFQGIAGAVAQPAGVVPPRRKSLAGGEKISS